MAYSSRCQGGISSRSGSTSNIYCRLGIAPEDHDSKPAFAVERHVNPPEGLFFHRFGGAADRRFAAVTGLSRRRGALVARTEFARWEWRLLLAPRCRRWWTGAWLATRRSAVDRRTATMLFACRNRSRSMRSGWPRNRGVHGGLEVRAVGDSAGEDRVCCGGAPARRQRFGHSRADRAVIERTIMGSSVRRHLSPQEAGELSGDGRGHDRLDVLSGRQGAEPARQANLGLPGPGRGCRRDSLLAGSKTGADMGLVLIRPGCFAQLSSDVAVAGPGDRAAVLRQASRVLRAGQPGEAHEGTGPCEAAPVEDLRRQ